MRKALVLVTALVPAPMHSDERFFFVVIMYYTSAGQHLDVSIRYSNSSPNYGGGSVDGGERDLYSMLKTFVSRQAHR